jgi:hypothetical protein
MTSDCGRCGMPVEPNDGYVLYTSPDHPGRKGRGSAEVTR